MTPVGKRVVEDLTIGYVARPNSGGMNWEQSEALAKALVAAIEAGAAAAERERLRLWATANVDLLVGILTSSYANSETRDAAVAMWRRDMLAAIGDGGGSDRP